MDRERLAQAIGMRASLAVVWAPPHHVENLPKPMNYQKKLLFLFTWLILLASGLSFHATTHTIEVMAGHVLGKVAKYYERYFVHWFNDMVSWIFTPWKNSQLKQAKKSTLCK